MDILDQELHIKDYLRVLNKRKLTVAAVFCVIAVFYISRVFLETPIYQATTRVLIEKGTPQNLSIVNSYYIPWDPDFFATQAQLIRSAVIGEKVVNTLKLDESWHRYGSGTTDKGGDKVQAAPPPAEVLAKMVAGGLMVSPVKESKVMNISYQSPNPELAALIVNTVIDAYMEELLEIKMSTSRYAINWMSEKAKEEAAKLETAERALQEYMRANDIITLENRIAIVPQRLSELSMELTRAETKRKELEAIYGKVSGPAVKRGALEAVPSVEADATLQELRRQILEAEQNITELSKKFGEKHPKMKVARGDLDVLKKKQSEEVRRVIDTIENEYELALAQEKDLRARLAETKNEAIGLNEKFIQYEVLKREVDTNRQFYDALMTRTKEHSITEQIQSTSVWVLEKAQVPKAPVKPNKRKGVLVGIILGLIGGVGMAFFVEYLDNTVKSPEEVERKTGVPVLGMVPVLKEKGKEIESMVLKEPRSAFGESYKALRTAVLLSKAEHPPKTVLITSTVPGEGKTATAVNLAVATALSDYKVLLIDGDLRRHRINTIFKVPNVKGLSTYLAGVSDKDIIAPTAVPNLSVLTPGPVPPNSSELLSSPKMAELMKELREQFDFIIFDSSPVMTVADSLILSQDADATIVIARAGKTTYEMIRRAIRSLQDVNASILGIVVNAHDEARSGYYYYKYHDYYGYQEQSDEA